MGVATGLPFGAGRRSPAWTRVVAMSRTGLVIGLLEFKKVSRRFARFSTDQMLAVSDPADRCWSMNLWRDYLPPAIAGTIIIVSPSLTGVAGPLPCRMSSSLT